MKIGHFKKIFKATKAEVDTFKEVQDSIVVEEALQINLNGKAFTVTMRTPGSDRFLIRGLLFTEGIYTAGEALKMKVAEFTNEGYPAVVDVWIQPEYLGGAYYQSRSMLSVSSCGICGKRELNDLLKGGGPLKTEEMVDPGLIKKMYGIMRSNQTAFKCTGGSHAAAVFDKNGVLIAVEEDIGRHNAVDKVIGNILCSPEDYQPLFMLVSGRVSYEIVSKTYKAGIPFLAAVSSPSSLSIESANEMGITLMAFCRGDVLTCYTQKDRMVASHKTL